MIRAQILTDSISPAGVRLTSMLLTYPRFIHSEFMTHRMFSRNAASSRAIPFERMVKMIQEEPAMPVKWGTHQKGMQSGPPLDEGEAEKAKRVWLRAMEDAIGHAKQLDLRGVHKSISNRLLEPFAHMTTIVTATEWENFFALRAHPDAQPEFQELAYYMLNEYLDHTPKHSGIHLPFISDSEYDHLVLTPDEISKVSAARCARVSYANFKENSYQDDINLANRLIESGHWSPFEHVARALTTPYKWSGNFQGWHQYRKSFDNENRMNVNLEEIRRNRGR